MSEHDAEFNALHSFVCPHCKVPLYQRGAIGADRPVKPETGDIAICAECVSILTFESPSEVRDMLATELLNLSDELFLQTGLTYKAMLRIRKQRQ